MDRYRKTGLALAKRLGMLLDLDERVLLGPDLVEHAQLYGRVEVAMLRMAGKREWP